MSSADQPEQEEVAPTLLNFIRKFSPDNIISASNTQASAQRKVRAAIAAQYPMLTEDELADILPKKEGLTAVKCQQHVTMIVVNKTIMFFQERDGPYFPTLKLLHKYPFLLPRMQCDIKGCKFVLGGSNVMAPGLTSPGGICVDGLSVGTLVCVAIEGKEHAVAVGRLLMSSEDIRKENRGHAIENIHVMRDGLWQHGSI